MKKNIVKIGWMGMMIFMILFSPFSTLFFQKNQSKKIISNFRSTGWWEEKSSNTELRFSTCNLHQLEWKEENEFIYQGEFYDVLDRTDSCGVIIFKVYHDNKDSQWYAMKEINKKQNTKKVNKNPTFTYFFNSFIPNKFPFFELFKKNEIPQYQRFGFSVSTQTPTPPPKI